MYEKVSGRIGIFVVGSSAIVLQIALVRQSLTLFYGTEINLGIVFFFWLLAEGLGIYLSLYLRRVSISAKFLAAVIYLFSLLVILVGMSVFYLRKLILPVQGEISIFKGVITTSFLLVFPLSFFAGIMFLAASRFVSSLSVKRITYSYSIDSLAASLLGFMASIFFIRYFSFLKIFLAVSLLNFVFSSWMFVKQHENKKILLVLVMIFIVLFSFALTSEGRLQNILWRGYKIVSEANSIYGYDVLVKKGKQKSIFSNGNLITSWPDSYTAEETIHIPLLNNPTARRILIIGSPNPDLIRELNKYKSIREVDFVEIDPQVSSFVLSDSEWRRQVARAEFRVNLYNCDIRFFLKRRAPASFYDIAIVTYSLPYNLLLNRFFTQEFFKELKGVLKKKALVSFFLPGSETYFNKEEIFIINSLLRTLKSVFSSCLILPGSSIHFLAGEGIEFIRTWQDFERRRKFYSIRTSFVNKYFLFDRLSAARFSFLNNFRKRYASLSAINSDFNPIMYFLGSLFVFSFQIKILNIFLNVFYLKFFILLVLFSLMIMIYLFWAAKSKTRLLRFVASGLGFAQMSFQLLLIICFQIAFGYIYYQIGLLVSIFMLGYAAGSIIFLWIHKLNKDRRCDLVSICIMAILMLSWFLFFKYFAFRSNLIFLATSLLSGVLDGIIISALSYRVAKNSDSSAAISFIYGSELFGSSLGALVITSLFIPILGIKVSFLILVVMLSVSSLILERINVA